MQRVREIHVLNLGAGVQSTTLDLMFEAREIVYGGTPVVLDAEIFADTGEEPEAVYRHLAWLKSRPKPWPILVRDIGSRLGDDLKTGRRPKGAGQAPFASIPAFTIIEGGAPGRTKRQCSKEYKLEVIERALRRDVLKLKPRQRIPKGVHVFQYFGISWDEVSRASRIWERFHVTGESKIEPRFPLIDRQWTRANCLEYLKDRVPHEVPRSACVFCPFHSDAEWQRLKDANGADWQRALEIDRAIRDPASVSNRDLRQTMYLHRSCQPLTQIEFRPRENSKELQFGFGFGAECEGVCGV